MGKRYQAILKHLGRDFQSFDLAIHGSMTHLKERAKNCARIIIASPTPTHVQYLRELLPLGRPILCEKPVTKNLEEIEELHAECSKNGWRYNMVMQYRELDISREPRRASVYNYFRHGNDGLTWDCMQIIALAEGPVVLREDSPYWDCAINGRCLSIAQMDSAYILHIQKWLTDSLDQSMDDILTAHRKVKIYEEKNEFR